MHFLHLRLSGQALVAKEERKEEEKSKKVLHVYTIPSTAHTHACVHRDRAHFQGRKGPSFFFVEKRSEAFDKKMEGGAFKKWRLARKKAPPEKNERERGDPHRKDG